MIFTVIGYADGMFRHQDEQTGEWTPERREIHLYTTTPIDPSKGIGLFSRDFYIEHEKFHLVYQGKKALEEMLHKECKIESSKPYNHIESLIFIDEM